MEKVNITSLNDILLGVFNDPRSGMVSLDETSNLTLIRAMFAATEMPLQLSLEDQPKYLKRITALTLRPMEDENNMVERWNIAFTFMLYFISIQHNSIQPDEIWKIMSKAYYILMQKASPIPPLTIQSSNEDITTLISKMDNITRRDTIESMKIELIDMYEHDEIDEDNFLSKIAHLETLKKDV